MKKQLTLLLLISVASIGMISCNKDDDTATPTSQLTSGTWIISNFNENGNNETSHFTGYVFEFKSDGTLMATKNGSSSNGTWSNGTDNHSKLILNLGTGKPLEELNDDWNILEQSNTILKLQHTSGGNGGIDNLSFERN